MSHQRLLRTLLTGVLLITLGGCSDGVQISEDTPAGGVTTGENTDNGDSGATSGGDAGGDDGSADGGVNSGGDGTGSGTGSAVVTGVSPHDTGFKGDYYSGAGQCATCHDDIQDQNGSDISMVRDWSGSMMANSSRDPYWIAKVAAEIARNPHLEGELEDTCTRCHAPMANDTARKDGSEISLFDGGLLDPDNPLYDHAMDGVSCTLCHQMDDDGTLGSPESTSGNFNVLVQGSLSERPAYGPYSDPNGVRMRTQVQFNPVFGPHMSTSEVCAACHDLNTPSGGHLDGGQDGSQGGGVGAFFPEQMVYSEWKNSSFADSGESGRTCQSCHMPVVPGLAMLASQGGGVPREGFSRHTFLGANTVMQSMLLNYGAELGISVPDVHFEESIRRNREFLGTAAEIDIVDGEVVDGQLRARVTIRNRAGHKLPSGFASRRAYVHFVVRDDAEQVVFESGALNSDGSVVGLVSDTDSKLYEEHYQLIDSAEQVQVYEAIMGDVSDQVTHTLMEATQYLKDNRLLPAGFDKSSAPDNLRTAGLAAFDEDFQAGVDNILYDVALPLPIRGEYTVFAELVYQPLAFGHIQDLFEDAQLPAVSQFKAYFEGSPLKAEAIASSTVQVR